mmetsp:Transcript_8769/g.14227  ORF Transcript_8769/g.14227 Transcript_8769/m.14227 type:complete len:105 (-) Transcript_8769:416-730(-)
MSPIVTSAVLLFLIVPIDDDGTVTMDDSIVIAEAACGFIATEPRAIYVCRVNLLIIVFIVSRGGGQSMYPAEVATAAAAAADTGKGCLNAQYDNKPCCEVLRPT